MFLMGLGMLLPKGWIGFAYIGTALGGVLATLHFSDTVTTGSVITAAVVIVLSGLFTLRNNLRSFWHDLAVERGEQVAELEQHLRERDAEILKLHDESKQEIAHHLEEQRVIRHELKNENAALNAQLQIERAKTDLSALMEQLAAQHREAMEQIMVGQEKQQQIIELLAGSNGGHPSSER